jgi:hypothetical protein
MNKIFLNRIEKEARLTKCELRIFAYLDKQCHLAYKTKGSRKYQISAKRLSRILNISFSWTVKCLARLRQLGLINITHTFLIKDKVCKKTANIYQIFKKIKHLINTKILQVRASYLNTSKEWRFMFGTMSPLSQPYFPSIKWFK